MDCVLSVSSQFKSQIKPKDKLDKEQLNLKPESEPKMQLSMKELNEAKQVS